VAVVASVGGLGVMSTVLGALSQDFPVPVLYLQHGPGMPGPDPRGPLLQRRSRLPVAVAVDGQRLGPAGVTVVPTGYGATVEDGGYLRLASAPAGGGGDELLVSAAARYGPGVTAVILTGKLSDGALGARAVKRCGGRILVQDPASAAAPGMPSSAIGTGCVDFILPPDRLGSAIVALTVAPGGAELLAVAIPPWAQLGA
jgi:two-component system chemotaxis response regulator CheB